MGGGHAGSGHRGIQRQGLAGRFRPPAKRSPAFDRTLSPPRFRPHGLGDHHRGSQDVHASVHDQVQPAPASRHRYSGKRLRGERKGPDSLGQPLRRENMASYLPCAGLPPTVAITLPGRFSRPSYHLSISRLVTPLAVVSLWLVVWATPAEALRVCADPDYLPYSNRAGEGFENKIAQAVAKALGEKVEYTWASYRGHGGFSQFLSSTLDRKKCDVVINIPYGSRDELTTRPYYISSYVFVFE